MSEGETSRAAEHMRAFAERSGLTSEGTGERYLWTDAYGVCTLVGLARETGDDTYLEMACELVDRVHETLGRHRSDTETEGWLSGLTDDDAREHPTRGGLRIGKQLPERPRDAPIDREEEWDRDGQYFHYNTKWMYALDVLARATGDSRYNRWARELAQVSHDAFVYTPSSGRRPRMYWKMRVDLSEPLVETMGQHDPLDGYVTYRQLRVTAQQLGAEEGPDVADAIESFEAMAMSGRWATEDPLGLGGLLLHGRREAWLARETDADDLSTLGDILGAARRGLDRFARRARLDRPASERLAFRELGLAIGLRAAVDLEEQLGVDGPVFGEATIQRRSLAKIVGHRMLGDEIVAFWDEGRHREVETWREHCDINQVMLATALAPWGCARIPHVD